jgi:HEXXH motif-containing protein
MTSAPPALSPHRIDAPTFRALARTGGDAETIRSLMAGQRSRHALLLREVLLESARYAQAVHAAQVHRAVAALDTLQRRHPEAAGHVLEYPLVGAWVAHCLRRLRSADPSAGAVPLWVDLGHLNAVVGAIAVRAGAPVDLDLPLRDGRTALPGLGAATVGGRARFGVARLHGGSQGYALEGLQGCVDIPAVDAPPTASRTALWSPVTICRFEDSGYQLTVVLDDLDPYRDCHGLTSAEPLTMAERATWHARLTEAWQVLCRRHPHRAEELSAVPLILVPLEPIHDGPGVNATARDSTGAVAMSPPVDGVDLAQSLLHEFQHSKLGALLDLVDLYDLDDRRLYYSPWRADPRPLGGLIQAVYAFLAVADFWRRHLVTGDELNVALAYYKLARSRQQLTATLHTIRDSGALTDSGRMFVDGLREAVDDVHDVLVPEEALIRAAVVNEHHRIAWRLRNRKVPDDVAWSLADAYLAGERPDRRVSKDRTPPDASAPRYEEEPLDELARLELADTLTMTRSARNLRGPTGDLALLRRDYDWAAKAYLAEIAVDPASAVAWAGLAVARQYSPGTAANVYRDSPELVAAVVPALRQRLGSGAPPPDAVARWLA